MIKNPSKLTLNCTSRAILKILDEGLVSSVPSVHFKKYILKNKIQLPLSQIDLKKYDHVFLVAIGKSAGIMTEYVSKKIDFKNGIVVVPNGIKPKLKKSIFTIINAGHPIPNQNSFRAGKKLVSFLNNTTKNDFVVFLISGGGSALSVYPDFISLRDKILVNKILIRSGADIKEIACIRKHLSLIKGGRLIQNMNSTGISFLVSDVIGDDIGSISSGTTFCDKSSFSDAEKIIKKFSFERKFPKSVLHVLKSGLNGKILETPKKPMIKNIVILNNFTCLSKMKNKSKKLGYNTHVLPNMTGNLDQVTKTIASIAINSKSNCIVFGGEPTLNVTGTGKGGRNQELVLRLYEKLKHTQYNFTIASIGTDGIDGNTKFAGSMFSTQYSCDGKLYLKNNDSSSFFKKFGGLIKTGITQNNVNDIGVIIRHNL
jgi:hydroxypyruvate reductase